MICPAPRFSQSKPSWNIQRKAWPELGKTDTCVKENDGCEPGKQGPRASSGRGGTRKFSLRVKSKPSCEDLPFLPFISPASWNMLSPRIDVFVQVMRSRSGMATNSYTSCIWYSLCGPFAGKFPQRTGTSYPDSDTWLVLFKYKC